MSMTGFVARHTGMPTLVPDPGRGKVLTRDDERLIELEPDGTPISDPLAPLGAETVYVQAGAYVHLTRPSYGTSIVTPADGHGPVAVDVIGEDSWSAQTSVATAQTVGGPADRWPSVPDPVSVSVELRTRGAAASARLLEILRTPGRVVLLRDPAESDVPDDDVQPVRVLTVTRAQADRTRSTLRATREWQVTATLRDGLSDPTSRRRAVEGDGSPCITWGEWVDLMSRDARAETWSYDQVAREIAGMP